MVADAAGAAPGDITTVFGTGAGGVSGDGGPATGANIGRPWGLARGPGGTFISQNTAHRLRHVDTSGVIATVAGGGVVPLGDGGQATDAILNEPNGVAVDGNGNLFISESAGHRVRKVDAATGVITTVAGTGSAGFSGDGGAGSAAQLRSPRHLAVDSGGNAFIADSGNHRVRRVDATTGEITTVAGTGGADASGDGGPATAATLGAHGIAIDPADNLFVSDSNALVRKVDAATGTITTAAGTGIRGHSGDGGLATEAELEVPVGLATDSAGHLFIAANRVRRVDAGTGIITTVVDVPGANRGLGRDLAGNLFISLHTVVQRVDAASGAITTVAGAQPVGNADPGYGFDGDHGPASAARLSGPDQLVAVSGQLLIADRGNNRVRRIGTDGFIVTVAGGGVGDGNHATTAAVLNSPRAVAVDGAGNPLVADCVSGKVRRVDLASGIISAVAGGGLPSDHVGDGGAATSAALRCPSGVAVVTSGPGTGTIYVADAVGNRVRKIDAGGLITTVAGDGTAAFGGDGGPATSAKLNAPGGVRLDGLGNLLVADSGNNRIRRIDPSGRITTVAGDGAFAIGSDGVAATAGSLAEPTDVVREASGALVISEAGFHRLRRVSPAGVITTIAGNGIPAFTGDGGPARDALLSLPSQLELDAGGVLFSDRGNHRIRRVAAGDPPPLPTSGCGMRITKNTTLKADLGPCARDGIVVGADNITLNLNGFSVIGTDATGDFAGVRLYGRKGVTIRGGGTAVKRGTVRGFDAGVLVLGGSGNTIQDLVVRDNIGPPSTNVANLGDGIGVFFSSDNRVLSSVVANNGIYDGIGILGFGAHRNLVQDTVVERTNRRGLGGPTGIGIAVTPFLSEELPRGHSLVGNRFISNAIRDNENSGLSNISNVDGVIRGNVVERNGRAVGAIPGNGIGVQNLDLAQRDTHVVVQGNTVVGNGRQGGPLTGNGIVVTSNENKVLGNQAHGNVSAGIAVVNSRLDGPQGRRNEIRDNNAADNGPQGFNRGDLVDTNAKISPDGFFVFDCDQNIWYGNVWGTGRYWPDPDLFGPGELEEEGFSAPEACTAVGGHAADSAGTAATSAALAPEPALMEAEPQVTPTESPRHAPPSDSRRFSRGNPPPATQ